MDDITDAVYEFWKQQNGKNPTILTQIEGFQREWTVRIITKPYLAGIGIYLQDHTGDVGRFTISDTEIGTVEIPLIGINVEDDRQGKGYAKLMIIALIYVLKLQGFQAGFQIFIGADSSNGFWRKIGFVDNRAYRQGSIASSKGYELSSTLGTLSKYALGGQIFNLSGDKKIKNLEDINLEDINLRKYKYK
jgi:GNAT superfamily N-acetyltransferase